jgi:thymidine kinase
VRRPRQLQGKILAVGATTSDDVLKIFQDHTNIQVIGVDEMQFYDPTLADVLKVIADQGVTIYASGLDMDFKADPWDTTDAMVLIADTLDTLMATCSTCNQKKATYTQRLIHDDTKVVIGGEDIYTARCPQHFEIS